MLPIFRSLPYPTVSVRHSSRVFEAGISFPNAALSTINDTQIIPRASRSMSRMNRGFKAMRGVNIVATVQRFKTDAFYFFFSE